VISFTASGSSAAIGACERGPQMDRSILTHDHEKTHDEFHVDQENLGVRLCELIGEAREGFGMIEDLTKLVEELLDFSKGKLMVF